ncbi:MULTISPECIES: hypothetical protein [Sphingomonas]|uniref:Uncharacterized protein n=1 Tax=Sphingomonas molluscorum TaxID=418184 RepID=A0ABU8Q7L4_9SPHN|nr:hypothetical protein [Sphingomonas sp. JUb134]MBM7407070.1 hypothetical protein [Sphingomonas sp. JUb134]
MVASPQSRPSLADQLERITPRFDDLTQRARLLEERPSADTVNDLEELAQGIARDIVAPFRGRGAKPVHSPLHVSADGTKGTW